MRHRFFLFFIILFLSSCSSVYESNIDKELAKGWFADKNEQCVPFARRVSGINIYGDAHTWWYKAKTENKFASPKQGAVIVLSKTRRLRFGHVAVVNDIVNSREINVTHTNWGSNKRNRRIVYDYMRVKDVSVHNDWSSVVFWNPHTNAFGSPYKVSGFIVGDSK